MNAVNDIEMKSLRNAIALSVLLCLGLVIFFQIVKGRERQLHTHAIVDTGHQLVSLAALHRSSDYAGNMPNQFYKALTSHAGSHKIEYLIAADVNGHTIASFTPETLKGNIPGYIRQNALAAMGLFHQSYAPINGFGTIHEFAKPIFEHGVKAGTVRIGVSSPEPSLLSAPYAPLLGIMALLIILTATVSHYCFRHFLAPLARLKSRIDEQNGITVKTYLRKGTSIKPMVRDLGSSVSALLKTSEQAGTANASLSMELGVLRYEHRHLTQLLNTIAFGIVVTDIQDHLVFINDYMVRRLDLNREEAVNRALHQLPFSKELLEFVSRESAISGSRSIHSMESSFAETAPGETFQVSLAYLEDTEKNPVSKLIMFKNVTNEKNAGQAIQEFSAHLTHELLTPITTIKSYSEMLMDDEIDDPETQKEFYNTINSETDRLTRLIKDLLNISKIEMGSMALDRKLVRSDSLMEDCLSAVEGEAKKKNINVQLLPPDTYPSLMGDKAQLKAALINILGNAVKYTPERGEIKFAIIEQENTVVFDIKDSGHGMSEKDLSHIFDKFYRSSNPLTAEQQGTGLGMAITSEIIRLHDGEIQVQSQLGQGSQFTVSIPKETYYLGK